MGNDSDKIKKSEVQEYIDRILAKEDDPYDRKSELTKIDYKVTEVDSPEPDPNNYQILIVDDDEGIHETLHSFFGFWGFEGISAYNAWDGIALALQYLPAAIILDINMPDVTGEFILKILKRIPTTQYLPVIILSGELDKKLVAKTYKDGAVKFISKPFDEIVFLKNLIACIHPDIVEKLELHKLIFKK